MHVAGAPDRHWAPLVALETATLLSAAGNGIALVTFPWIVLELTGSAAGVGLVAAAAALPLALSAFVSGTLVDRVGRRRTSVVSDVLSALSVAAVPVVAAFDLLSLPVLALLAATGAVFDPAGATARETMLPEAAAAARLRLERVNGVHEAVFGIAYLVGPGLGGLLIALVGAKATLWVTAVAFAISALVLLLVHVPGAGRPTDHGERASFWRESVEGLRFVWDDPTLRAITILFTVLVGAWVPIEGVVLPVYFEAQDAPERLGGLLMAMSGGGASARSPTAPGDTAGADAASPSSVSSARRSPPSAWRCCRRTGRSSCSACSRGSASGRSTRSRTSRSRSAPRPGCEGARSAS